MSNLPQDPFQIAIDTATADPDPDPASKPWWESRAVWGVVVVLAAQIAALFGAEVDQATTLEAITGLVTIVGALVAWVGRVQAKRPISLRKIAPGVTLTEKDRP